MRLTKLELKGFKSFRDKTTLEFPDKFMGIVGPNGSGKSNITEAICFVLGKSRGLRAANLPELIFNGGLDKKPSDRAVVAITLKDNEGRRHKISRIIDRDGHSIYKLNDSRCTRQRIIDLIGDNEYNIILQDDVTKVIDMKPNERRTIIDNLCGIAEYDEKRDKSINELKKVEERISETHIILGEKLGYLKELRKERDEALKYQDARTTLKQSKATLLNKEIQSISKRGEKIDEDTVGMKASKEESLKSIGDAKTHISEKNSLLKDLSNQIIKLEEDKTGTKISATQSEIVRRQDKIAMLSERLEAVIQEFNEREDRKIMFNKDIRDYSEELEKMGHKLASLHKDLLKEGEKIGEGLVEDESDSIRENMFDYKSQVKATEESIESSRSDLNDLNVERKDYESRLKDLSTREQKTIKDVEKTRLEYERQTQAVSKYGEEAGIIRKALDELRYSMEASRIKLGEKQSELRTLERASSGLRGAVKAVMSLKKVLPGIHGPVSQLGKVKDSTYDLPMQVAAGARMQFIVVDTVDTSGKCIDYLRKKKVGRATFLPLDKIGGKTADSLPKDALGFTRDFIKCDKKYKKVFEYVFGNTILVKDIDSAKTVGIGKWRMVTLDGDLLELSGAMTGGFIKDRAEISFSNIEEIEEEIKTLEKHIVALEDDFEERQNAVKKIDTIILKQRSSVEQAKKTLDEGVLDLNLLTEKKDVIRNSLKQVIERIEVTDNKIREYELKTTEMRKTLSVTEKQLASMLEERGPIDRTQYDILKDEIRDVEVEDGRLNERISSLTSQISENDSLLSELIESRDSMNEEIGSLSSEVTEFQERLEEMMKQSTVIGTEIEAMIVKRNQYEEDITGLSESIGSNQKLIEEINENLSGYMIEKAKIETRLEDMNKDYERYDGVELLDKSVKDLEELASRMEGDLLAFGTVNLRAIETYDVIKNEYDEISEKLDTLKKERQSIFDFMEKIEQKKRVTFMEAFEKVKFNFERIFAELSEGKGTLILDNPMIVSESGLIIKASPGGKKIMSLDAMSGGEKVLTSAAFLLAVQQYKPSYFYVVDELDAALDKKNSVHLADMLKTSDSQFLMVTHNNSMLRYMDSAIGVSMQDAISHIVGVKFNGIQEEL